jgi:hypothetical protein
MRTQLLSYLTANLTGSIKSSQELPFEQGGTANYLRNLRRVYLDEPYTEQDILVNTLDESSDVNQSITRVRGYLAVDAKNRNADLDAALTVLANARTGANITNSFRKEFDYTVSMDDDRVVYEFEYRFYTLV